LVKRRRKHSKQIQTNKTLNQGIYNNSNNKTVPNIFLSRLTPYVDEIIGDHQCAFRLNRSNILIRYSAFVMLLERKWQYNGTVHQLFIDFKKAYDSVRREELYKNYH
jgi:hypothetical protein